MGNNLPETLLGSFIPESVAISYEFTCVYSNNGVKCFGNNNQGRLGIGSTNFIGSNANELGDNLNFTELGTNFIPKQVTLGNQHACALSTLNDIKCWGRSDEGELGQGNTDTIGNQPNEMGDNLLPLFKGCSTDNPTIIPSSQNPTINPTQNTKIPTHTPSLLPTLLPTINPTNIPTKNPTQNTKIPTLIPTNIPTINPSQNTQIPTLNPTKIPTINPTQNTKVPTIYPTNIPTINPTENTQIPTLNPTKIPTINPTQNMSAPTQTPTNIPTNMPTLLTDIPTIIPTIIPTEMPTKYPTNIPSLLPSQTPTKQITNNSTMNPTNIPTINPTQNTQIPTLTPTYYPTTSSSLITQITTGTNHNCVMFDNRDVKCWGNNDYGQLGNQQTINIGDNENVCNITAINFGDNFIPDKLYSNENYNCVLSINNTVKCWGRNNKGQLGYGDRINRGGLSTDMGNNLTLINFGNNFIPKQLTLGQRHACAISTLNDVKCWGHGNNGKLGIGNQSDIYSPQYLPSINLGTNFTAKKVIAYKSNTCVLSIDNELKCFGNGGITAQSSFQDTGDKPDEMGDNLPIINFGDNFIIKDVVGDSISDHACVISTNNTVKCWGHCVGGWYVQYTSLILYSYINTIYYILIGVVMEY